MLTTLKWTYFTSDFGTLVTRFWLEVFLFAFTLDSGWNGSVYSARKHIRWKCCEYHFCFFAEIVVRGSYVQWGERKCRNIADLSGEPSTIWLPTSIDVRWKYGDSGGIWILDYLNTNQFWSAVATCSVQNVSFTIYQFRQHVVMEKSLSMEPSRFCKRVCYIQERLIVRWWNSFENFERKTFVNVLFVHFSHSFHRQSCCMV